MNDPVRRRPGLTSVALLQGLVAAIGVGGDILPSDVRYRYSGTIMNADNFALTPRAARYAPYSQKKRRKAERNRRSQMLKCERRRYANR